MSTTTSKTVTLKKYTTEQFLLDMLNGVVDETTLNNSFSITKTVKGVITGTTGNDFIQGTVGADIMAGGLGDDVYIVNNAGDMIREYVNQGNDTAVTSVDYSLVGTQVENMVLIKGALNGIGNELNNVLAGFGEKVVGGVDQRLDGGAGNDSLFGFAGMDTLIGGTGADLLAGGVGNDVYYVDNEGDAVVELSSIRLSDVTALDASRTGTLLPDYMLSEYTYGLDYYYPGYYTPVTSPDPIDYSSLNIGAFLTRGLFGSGIDTVYSSISYTLSANIENLTLQGSNALNGTGNSLNNLIIGNSANNILDGKTGIDTMLGGDGNDIYYVDNSSDVVVEVNGDGVDLVYTTASYSLDTVEGQFINNLTMLGTDNLSAMGNFVQNVIIGNSGNNYINGGAGDDSLYGGLGSDTLVGDTGNDWLDGGLGNDTMIGGTQNDTFIVDSLGDVVIENATSGADKVMSSVSFTLGDNIENLELTGAVNINGTGNALNNLIIGNTGNNVLSGLDGRDTLIGGLGNDTLIGGNQGNVYQFGFGDGHDVINDFDTSVLNFNADKTLFNADITRRDVGFFRQGNDLLIGYRRTDDTISVSNQYLSRNYAVENFELASGGSLTAAQVNTVITQMASFAANNGIAFTSLNDVLRSDALMNIITNSWQPALA